MSDRKKSHLSTFIHGSIVSLIGAGLLGLINFFIRRSLALELSKEDYGFFYSAFALLMLMLNFSDIGVGQAGTLLIVKSNASGDRDRLNRFFSMVFFLKSAIGIVLFLLVWTFCVPIVNRYLDGKHYLEFSMLALLLIFQNLEGVFTSIWNGLKKFLLANVSALARSGLILVTVLVLFSGEQLLGVVKAFVFTSMIFASLALFISVFSLDLKISFSFSWQDFRKVFALSGWMAVYVAMANTMCYMDTVMLTYIKGLESSAVYNVALPLMQIVQSLMIFPTVFLPIATEMWHERKIRQLHHMCLYAAALAVVASPLVAGFFYFFGNDLIHIAFRGKYDGAGALLPLTVLCFGMVFWALANFVFQVLNSSGHEKKTALLTIAGAVMNITLNSILIPFYDFNGAAIATAATYFAIAVAAVVCFYLTVGRKV